jgi:hypothetical protein
MRFSLVRGSTYLLAASLLVPAGLWATTAKSQPAAPASPSYTGDFSRQANQLFEQIRYDVDQVQRAADELTTFTRTYEVSWVSNADDLEQAKEYVNRMGADIHRLQNIQTSVLPWQKKAIAQMTPRAAALANDTQHAIRLLDHNQGRLFATNYSQYVNAMYNEARQISNSVNSDVHYAQARHTLDRLENHMTASGL